MKDCLCGREVRCTENDKINIIEEHMYYASTKIVLVKMKGDKELWQFSQQDINRMLKGETVDTFYLGDERA